jgi:hypothetical protein
MHGILKGDKGVDGKCCPFDHWDVNGSAEMSNLRGR